jgi:hypothetical protein
LSIREVKVFDPKVVEKALEQQIVRMVAGFGVLLLVANAIGLILFRLGSAVESRAIFNAVWQLTYTEIIAAMVAGGLWVFLAATRSYEQPWWVIVLGAFAAWVFVIRPLALELPNFLANMVLILGDIAQLAAVLLAIALLDRAIPTASAAGHAGAAGHDAVAGGLYGGGRGGPGSFAGGQPQEQPDDGYDDRRAGLGGYNAQQDGGENPASSGPAPGWYPDPHGQASSRWWDGARWSDEVR